MKLRTDIILIVVAAGLLFIPFLGAARLFDWDEINFAECAREMLATGDYLRVQIDYSPFWEKPPLFIWLQAASMSVFGINEFAARLPNAVIGMITLPLLYFWGVRLRSRRFGLLWAAAYAGSFLPHFYFRSAIIDPLFNLLIYAGIMTLATATVPIKPRRTAFAGTLIGLAMLTKGPVALLLSMLTIAAVAVWSYLSIKRKSKHKPGKNDTMIFGSFTSSASILGIFSVFSLAAASLWFGFDIIRNGTWFVSEFINYQIRLLTTGDAGHGGPFYYHTIVLLLGCFPASLFALWSLFVPTDINFRIARLWNIALFLVVLIVFSIVKTKIVHYSSLCYFPLTFLAAVWEDKLIGNKAQCKKRHTAIVGIFAAFWAVALAAVPVIGMNKEFVMPYIADDFARANLTAPVQWNGWEPIVGLIYAVAMICALFLPARLKFPIVFASTAVAISLFLPLIAPKIEGYTQAAPIEFYESLRGRECYVKPVGFKSYAHLFYSRKPRVFSPAALGIAPDDFENRLFRGAIDKPAYFVCRQQDADKCRNERNIREIGAKAGFIFFERLP